MKNRNMNLIVLLLGCLALSPEAKAGPAAQTTNVNVVNTPNVNVVNTPTVKDMDNPARQPFETSTGVTIQDGSSVGVREITTVPAGKVLVIEQVSVDGRLTGQ